MASSILMVLSCSRSRHRGDGWKYCEQKSLNGVCAQSYPRIATPSNTTFINTIFNQLPCNYLQGRQIYRRDDVVLRSLKAPTPINASVFIFLYPM